MQFLLKILYRLGDYIRGFSLLITIIVCGGKCTSIPRVGKNFTLKYPPHSGITIGAGCDFGPGTFIDCPPGSILSIGSNVKFTAGVIISCANKVSIGNNSLIAEYCCIRDSQHKYKKDVPIRMQGLSIGSITIGEDVWIGRSSSILMNTHIADGCVIGAASVLKGFVSMPNTVNSGSPVEFVKHRV
jgi:serine acetyltransferase